MFYRKIFRVTNLFKNNKRQLTARAAGAGTSARRYYKIYQLLLQITTTSLLKSMEKLITKCDSFIANCDSC